MYKHYPTEQIVNGSGETITITHAMVMRIADKAHIPFDPANTDYQEYLKWLSAGNEPLPPDSQE
jgi:hypothetical protein